MNGSKAGSQPELHHGRRRVAPQQLRKLTFFPAAQQEPKLLLIGQSIHVTSLAFTKLKYWENILISRFYEQFSRSSRNLDHCWKFEKISNSWNTNISYIILKRVIWGFHIYNLFHKIFKFCEDKSNNVFLEILKCFRKTAKFEFFAKQIIYLESPDHPFQNDV